MATRSRQTLNTVLQPGLAWLINSERKPQWQRIRRLTHGLNLETISGSGGKQDWLIQSVSRTEPWLTGIGCDRALLSALADNDLAKTTQVLKLWREKCLAQARPLTEHDNRHPFLPGVLAVPVLPADHLDIHPGNLIFTGKNTLTRIDTEWQAGTGVDAELVLLRALREFSREVRDSGAPHPWPAKTNLQELACQLSDLCGLGNVARQRWDELTLAEAVLQQLVTGRNKEQVLTSLRVDAAVPGPNRMWELAPHTDVGRLLSDQAARDEALQSLTASNDLLRQQIQEQQLELAELRTQLTQQHSKTEQLLHKAEQKQEKLQQRLSTALHDVAELDNQVGSAFAGLAEANQQLAFAQAVAEDIRSQLSEKSIHNNQLQDKLIRVQSRLDKLESASLVRYGHRYIWPAARAARGMRDLAFGRPGAEPDGVLRRISRYLPSITSLLARRTRRAHRDYREPRLRYQVAVPERPIYVGNGQVVELAGWVAHADLPTRAVWIKANGQSHQAIIGFYRPEVARELRSIGWHVPDGSGFRARITLPAKAYPQTLALELIVDLQDGTRLHRALAPLQLRSSAGLRPCSVQWSDQESRVAICLATYQANPQFLAEQLASIRAQTHRNWVCLIGDDGSDESTRQLISTLINEDSRFIFVKNSDNVGFYRNFERILKLIPADADFVALSDQDDIWDEDKLATLMAEFNSPEIQLAYSDMRLIDDCNQVIADTCWSQRRNQWRDLTALLTLNTVTGASTMVRAELIRQYVLPFPPGTATAYHDQWIAATALAKGRIAFVDRPLLSYRQHGSNVSGWVVPHWTANLPGLLGLLRLSLGNENFLSIRRRADLEHVIEHEFRRIAQFATTILLRNHAIGRKNRQQLRVLSMLDRKVAVVFRLAVKLRQKSATAKSERYFLTAALRWHALRRKRRQMPTRLADSLD